jgi:hypothetical protein
LQLSQNLQHSFGLYDHSRDADHVKALQTTEIDALDVLVDENDFVLGRHECSHRH